MRTAIRRVADGVVRATNRWTHWYLVEDGDRVTAIDAGLRPDHRLLLDALRSLGHEPRRLEAVVLTHAHVDHLGFAEWARRELGARVHLHADEVALARRPLRNDRSEVSPLPYLLRHPSARAFIADLILTGAMWPTPPRQVVTVGHGERLDDVPGRPVVVHTPGHTPGSMVLSLPERGVLFTGDALLTWHPYTGRSGPQIGSRGGDFDSALAMDSLARIEATAAPLLLPGHGDPFPGGATEAVRLARRAGHS